MREPSALRSGRAVLPPCGRAVLVELAVSGCSVSWCYAKLASSRL